MANRRTRKSKRRKRKQTGQTAHASLAGLAPLIFSKGIFDKILPSRSGVEIGQKQLISDLANPDTRQKKQRIKQKPIDLLITSPSSTVTSDSLSPNSLLPLISTPTAPMTHCLWY